MPRLLSGKILLLVLSVMLAACGDDDPPTVPTTPVSFTETFSGTLTPSSGATHPFTASLFGTVTASLTAVSPDNTLVLGLSLGTWNGVVCQIVLANDKALLNSVIVGNATGPGALCVRVYDVGTLVEPTSYEIQVVHP